MAGLLLLPFLIIRFPLLNYLNKAAIKRAAHFPSFQNKERIPYILYQLSNIGILITPFFMSIKSIPAIIFYSGLIFYILGNIFLISSIFSFAKPSKSGLNQTGIYKVSRNPMYVAYFTYFISLCLLTQSLVLTMFVIVFIITTHWIIVAEERWCIESLGTDYMDYMKSVRRYI